MKLNSANQKRRKWNGTNCNLITERIPARLYLKHEVPGNHVITFQKQPSLQKLFSCLIEIIRHETSVMCLLPEKWYSIYSFLGKFNILSHFDSATSQHECHALFIRHYGYSEFQKHLYGLRQHDSQSTYKVTRGALLCNHCYYVKAVSITYCRCVFVA